MSLLRARRKRRGWTLADLSARTGVPESTLAGFEDHVPKQWLALVRVCRALGTTPERLVGHLVPDAAAPEGVPLPAHWRAARGVATLEVTPANDTTATRAA